MSVNIVEQKDFIVASARGLWEAAVYAQLPQPDGIFFCLLRTKAEETVTQSLGRHGKAGKISMAASCAVQGFDDLYLLPKWDIPGSLGSLEPTSRKHYYYLSLDRRDTMFFRYTGYEKSVKTMNKEVAF